MTESTRKAHAASPDPGVAVLLGPTDGDTEMKTFAACLALLCAAPALYAADPAVRLLILTEPVDLDAYGPAALREKAGHDSVSDALLLPYFASATDSDAGPSTLFAVRNESERELRVRVLYLTLQGEEQAVEEIALVSRETRTINLRNVDGLRLDSDGVARGVVVLGVIGERGDLISGDYFLLDSATGEANGGTLLNMSIDDPGNEFCAEWSTRLMAGGAFGGRTRLRLVADWPQGRSEYDSPTAVGTVYGEDGAALRSFEVRADAHSFELEAAELLPAGVAFGSLVVRFLGAEGAVLAEHSGAGSLSVALKAVCR